MLDIFMMESGAGAFPLVEEEAPEFILEILRKGAVRVKLLKDIEELVKLLLVQGTLFFSLDELRSNYEGCLQAKRK